MEPRFVSQTQQLMLQNIRLQYILTDGVEPFRQTSYPVENKYYILIMIGISYLDTFFFRQWQLLVRSGGSMQQGLTVRPGQEHQLLHTHQRVFHASDVLNSVRI